MECVTLRLIARVAEDRPARKDATGGGDRKADPRQAHFGPVYGQMETPVIDRAELTDPVTGPIIVEEYDSTCIASPGWKVTLDMQNNIVMTREHLMIVQSSNVDPITIEAVQNALGAIADEMALLCAPPIPPSCVIPWTIRRAFAIAKDASSPTG